MLTDHMGARMRDAGVSIFVVDEQGNPLPHRNDINDSIVRVKSRRSSG